MESDDKGESDEHFFNPSADDVGVEDLEKMKGDAIGDTMYSERWVLQILIKVTKLFDADWDEQLESELCSLWDMTVEKDVVDFLLKHDILSIMACAMRPMSRKNNSRLTEILVGIMGNLCAQESIRKELIKVPEIVYQLIALLEDPDPHVLTQLIRLFHCCAWDLVADNSDVSPHWLEGPINCGQLNNLFAFILKSSTSEELIFAVLEFLNTMCSLEINDKDFSSSFCTAEMVCGMTDAWHQLFGSWSPEEEFPSKPLTKAAAHWTTILLAFAGQEHGRELLLDNGMDLGHILCRIALRPVESFDTILIATVDLLEVLIKIYFNGTVLKRLLEVLNVLYQNQGDPGSEATATPENLDAVLKDSIESYCSNVFCIVSRPSLNRILADCSENHVLLFWKTISDRQADEPGERAI